MAITSNSGSLFLASATPRLLVSANAALLLSVSAPLFQVSNTGTPNIPSITVSAQLIQLDGVVTYTCVGGTLTPAANNSTTLLYTDMSASVATITATLVYRGTTFTRDTKISKVLDSTGLNGISNAVVYAYQRSATVPVGTPGSITYDFSTGNITSPVTLLNGWLKTIPTGTDPLYVTTASAANSAATDAIASTEWSGAVVLAQNGTQGLSVATIYLYQRTTANTAPPLPSVNVTFTFATGVLTGVNNGWTPTVPPAASGGYLWVTTATASNTTTTDIIAATEWAAAQILSQDGTGTGPSGTSVAIATLYQWSTVAPAAPTGTAAFTWASASVTSYSVSDGWTITPATNPGIPGIQLWLANKPITAPAGTTSTAVTFAVGANIAAYTQNGANGGQGVPGIKTATASAYQWALSAPTTTGTAVYTWSSGVYDTPPSTGWTSTKGTAPGVNYTLYEASVRLVDSTGATTSSVDWTTASVSGIAFMPTTTAGSQGASAKRAYVLVVGFTLAATPTTFTATGTALPTTGTWGETNVWQATPPTAAAGESVFQSDGIYDPAANNTVWNVPYLSNLKVGNLSAISANLGTITSGSIDIGGGKAIIDVNGNASFKGVTIKDAAGNIILSSGAALNPAFAAAGTLNSGISIGSNGVLSGAGGGGVTIGGLGYSGSMTATTNTGAFATLSGPFTGANAANYFADNSIAGTYIANLAASKITAGTLTGFTIYGGAGNTPTGKAFEVTSGGVVWVDGIFGGTSSWDNVYLASSAALSARSAAPSHPGIYAVHNSTGSAISTVAASGTAISIGSSSNSIVVSGTGPTWTANIYPHTDNSFQLGASGGYRWTALYAMSSTITTSDVRTKTAVRDAPLSLNFILRLRSVAYKMIVAENVVSMVPGPDVEEEGPMTVVPGVATIDDPEPMPVAVRGAPVRVPGPHVKVVTPRAGTRDHYGFLAQEVRAAMLACGVDDASFWSLADPSDPDSAQALRYEGFIAPMVKAIQEQQAMILEMSARITALEGAN